MTGVTTIVASPAVSNRAGIISLPCYVINPNANQPTSLFSNRVSPGGAASFRSEHFSVQNLSFSFRASSYIETDSYRAASVSNAVSHTSVTRPRSLFEIISDFFENLFDDINGPFRRRSSSRNEVSNSSGATNITEANLVTSQSLREINQREFSMSMTRIDYSASIGHHEDISDETNITHVEFISDDGKKQKLKIPKEGLVVGNIRIFRNGTYVHEKGRAALENNRIRVFNRSRAIADVIIQSDESRQRTPPPTAPAVEDECIQPPYEPEVPPSRPVPPQFLNPLPTAIPAR